MLIINTQESTQRIIAAKLTRLTHKIAIQLPLVAESCTICSSHSKWPIGKLLDTPSYVICAYVKFNINTSHITFCGPLSVSVEEKITIFSINIMKHNISLLWVV